MWLVATRLESKNIERAYDGEILYPMHPHLLPFAKGNVYFNYLILVILLLPPFFKYIYVCLISFQTVQLTQPWWGGLSYLPTQ